MRAATPKRYLPGGKPTSVQLVAVREVHGRSGSVAVETTYRTSGRPPFKADGVQDTTASEPRTTTAGACGRDGAIAAMIGALGGEVISPTVFDALTTT